MDWRNLLSQRPTQAMAPPPAAQPAPQGAIGTGVAYRASDAQRLFPKWKQALAAGQTDLDFTDWLQQYSQNEPKQF